MASPVLEQFATSDKPVNVTEIYKPSNHHTLELGVVRGHLGIQITDHDHNVTFWKSVLNYSLHSSRLCRKSSKYNLDRNFSVEILSEIGVQVMRARLTIVVGSSLTLNLRLLILGISWETSV